VDAMDTTYLCMCGMMKVNNSAGGECVTYVLMSWKANEQGNTRVY